MENIILVTESQLKQIVKDAIRECFGTHNFSTENQKIYTPPHLPDETDLYEFLNHGLSTRAYNPLRYNKINTLGQLRRLDIEVYKKFRNVGQMSVNEVIALLEKYGK